MAARFTFRFGCLLAGLLFACAAGCGAPPADTATAAAAPAATGAPAATANSGTGVARATAPADPATGAEPAAPKDLPPIAAGQVDLTPIADTCIACYPIGARSATAKDSEQSWNYGKNQQLKIKRQENIALLKFDFSKVPAGATLTSAAIVVTMANKKAFNHMAVYSLHVDWNEGSGQNPEDAKPITTDDTGACFLGPKGVNSQWRSWKDSDFAHAAAGNGGNLSSLTRAKNLGNDKWEITFDPAVVAAAIADGQTLCLNEETGAWGNDYSNAWIYSREAGADKAPLLKLAWQAGRDTNPPAFQGKLAVQAGPMPGSLLLNLPAAVGDSLVDEKAGPAAPAVGYTLTIDGRKVPPVEISRPTWHHREMFLTDLPVGQQVTVELAAFDQAGNTAKLTATATTGGAWAQKLAEPAATKQDLPADPTFDTFTLKLEDGTTLFDPLTGGLNPFQQRAELGKPSADARYQTVTRGDILGLQAVITLKDGTDTLEGVKLALSDFKAVAGEGLIKGDSAIFHREHFVKMEVNKQELWAADPLQVLGATAAVKIPSQSNLEKQRAAVYYLDLLVPKTIEPGRYDGALTVTQGDQTQQIPIRLQVAAPVLPDLLTFIVEMNAYGHPNKELFYKIYRAFHAHRLSYNCLPYGHSRAISDPSILPLAGEGKDLKITDFSKYDALYGPILDGTVAQGLPRDGAPATHWYLPFNESWPVDLEATDPNKACWEGRVAPAKDKKGFEAWLDRCLVADPLVPDHFSATWRDGTAAVCKQFAQHADEKGWTRTALQFFSNHKMYFESGSLSLWVMDEPQYGRDYRALDWLMAFYARAVAGCKANFEIRNDISRPGWMGDRVDAGLGMTCSSGSIETDHALVTRRIIATGKPYWWYGGAGDASTDPAAMTALFIRKWSLGCVGGLPNWTAVSGPKEWDKTDGLRYIVYDPQTNDPQPTMRMKACREGQEMMELINQVAAKPGFNRWMVAELVNKEFAVKIVTISKNVDDPGYSTFEGLDSAALDRLRKKLIATLEAK